MDKIAFLGAGSTVFAKNVLGDCMLTGPLQEFEYALYDIDMQRLEESWQMLSNINRNSNGGRARIVKYTDRMEALRGARYVINAIQVGLYDPCTIIDFEVPKKYGLRQTIGDTLGIGGIMKARQIVLIAYGVSKAQAVRDMIKGPVDPMCPASVLQLHPDTVILLDAQAASLL